MIVGNPWNPILAKGRVMTARKQEAALMVDLKGAAKEMNPRWGSNTKYNTER